MASSKVLLVFLIIAAGYTFVSNYTLTKGAIARTNGQHLYLKSSIWGIIFLIIGSFLQGETKTTENLFIFPGITYLIGDNLDPLTIAAFTAIEISILFLILLEAPIKISNLIGEDIKLDQILEKRFSNTFINKAMVALEASWLTVQLFSLKYAKTVEKASLRNNQVDLIIWEALISDEEVIMVCDDNGKVFIGFPLQVPDPKQSPEEKTIKIVPIMSGALCNDYRNLHITTDYTENAFPYKTTSQEIDDTEQEFDEESDYLTSSPAILIYTKKIKYLRKFDIDMFESFFRRKVCACGNEIYQPIPQHQKVSLLTSSQSVQ